MVNLTKRQQDILVGTILGDGCLEVNGKYVRLKVDHNIKQKQLTDWIFNEFRNFCSKRPYFLDQSDVRTNKSYHHYRFSTLSSPVLNKYYLMFYQLNRKIVPENIKTLLKSSLSLAVWYMDDGFRRLDCNGIYLCTSAFTNLEQLLLIETLKVNFNLDARVHWAAGNARIYIPSSSAKMFCNLIKEYVLSDLSYKLISDPVTTRPLYRGPMEGTR